MPRAALTGAGEPPPAPDLYRKLLLLTGVRLLVGTALLSATGWLTLGAGESFGRRVDAMLYATIGGIYVASLVSGWFLRKGRYLRAVAYAQIAGDVISASGLVYLTGGAESFFTILYPLAIINAAISLSRRGAMVAAASSSVAFCLLAMLMEQGMLAQPAAFLERPPLSLARLLLTVSANLSAFFLTAALAAHLANTLQGVRRQLAQKETQYSALDQLYRIIVESISSGLVTVNGAMRITFLNATGRAIFGVEGSEVVGEPLEARFPFFAEALRRSQPGRGEARIRRTDGTERILGYSIAPLLETGTPSRPGYVIVFQDLTPFRELEDAMRRSDRLAAVGKLAAGLAHEIRNPLAAMCGSIQMLESMAVLPENDRGLLKIVLREGERLEALVRDFLSFARPKEPQLQAMDGSELIGEALAVFGSETAARGLRLSAQVMPGVRVRADGGQLRQVLWNLLGNAADACEHGGEVRVRFFRDGGHALLEVEDTGKGIAADDLPRIFDPFFTTKDSGTGLGLAIVHRIVEAHAGRISVSSTAGSGATFRVELQLEQQRLQLALPAAALPAHVG